MTINILGCPGSGPAILEWLKDLGPLAVAAAVFFVTWSFYRSQVRLAKQKLRHDLYDRRFAIYKAFRELLVGLIERSDDEIRTLFQKAEIARSEAPFLLDDPEIQAYLDDLSNEIGNGVIRNIMFLHGTRDPAMLSDPQIVKQVIEKGSRLGTVKLQLADVHIMRLSQHFARFLRLTDFSK